MTDTAHRAAPLDHAIWFYDHDSQFVADLARFVLDGLAAGERVLVVATAEHRDDLDGALLRAGTDLEWARWSGRYVEMDAGETLARLTVNGVPDSQTFRQTIGPVLDVATADGSRLRVFGEMVGLLWSYGNVVGALELERLCSEIALGRQFRLLCGYPASTLSHASLEAVRRSCALHSAVLAPASYTVRDAHERPASPAATTAVFLPVPASVPAARRFVAGILTSRGSNDLLEDGSLIVSELATNAVRHAASPFRVTVECSPDRVRIAVEDLEPTRPLLRAAESEDHGGRGLAIIEHLAQRWGYDVLPVGKVIWAELPTGRP